MQSKTSRPRAFTNKNNRNVSYCFFSVNLIQRNSELKLNESIGKGKPHQSINASR